MPCLAGVPRCSQRFRSPCDVEEPFGQHYRERGACAEDQLVDCCHYLADVRQVFEVTRDGVHQFDHGHDIFVGESGRGFGQFQLHLCDCLGVVASCVGGGLACELGSEEKMLIAPGASVKSSRNPDCRAESGGETDCAAPSVPEEAVQVDHYV